MLPRLAHHYALPSRFALASTPSCVLSLSASTCCVCRNLCTSFSSILCRPPLDLCPCPDAKPHYVSYADTSPILCASTVLRHAALICVSRLALQPHKCVVPWP